MRYFEPDQEQLMVSRFVAGEGVAPIAKSLGTDFSVVARVLKRHGYQTRNITEAVRIRRYRDCKGTEHVPNDFYLTWKHGAARRGLSFDLSIQDIEDVYGSQGGTCYYTGIPLLTARFQEDAFKHNGKPDRISLDRKDPTVGYVKTNVVLCCVCINFGKKSWDEVTFKNLVALMRTHSPSTTSLSSANPSL